MTYQEKLILFMEGKQKKLKETFPDSSVSENYFTQSDRKTILNWSDADSQSVWDNIVKNIIEYKVNRLCGETCPFCISAADDCYYCNYHEDCVCIISNFCQITGLFRKSVQIREDLVFSSDFYENLIKEIEDKENG